MSPNPALLTWPSSVGEALVPTYVTAVGSAANASTYTFTNVAIGAASASRTVLVAVTTTGYVAGAGVDISVTSVTVGGLPATIDHGTWGDPASQAQSVAFARIAVPEGETATIVVTTGSAKTSSAIAVWTVDTAITVHSTTGSAPGEKSYGTSISATTALPSGGFALAAIARTSNPNPTTLTGEFALRAMNPATIDAGGHWFLDSVTPNASVGLVGAAPAYQVLGAIVYQRA